MPAKMPDIPAKPFTSACEVPNTESVLWEPALAISVSASTPRIRNSVMPSTIPTLVEKRAPEYTKLNTSTMHSAAQTIHTGVSDQPHELCSVLETKLPKGRKSVEGNTIQTARYSHATIGPIDGCRP